MAYKAIAQTKKTNSKPTHSASQIKKVAPNTAQNNFQNLIQSLQRSIGNQAVGRMYRSGMLQAKMKIGSPNDKYEREADHVADQVMNMPDTSVQRQVTPGEEEDIRQKPLAETITPLVQRQAEEDEDIQTQLEEEEPVQMSPLLQKQEDVEEEEEIQTKKDSSSEIPRISTLESGIASLKGSGTPLPKTERNFFEPRYGADFKNVKIHSGSNASSLAHSIQAKAFTVGNNIVFGRGQYSPGTAQGRKLLAHELTHVIQQEQRASQARYPSIRHSQGYAANLATGKSLVIQRKPCTVSDEYPPKRIKTTFKTNRIPIRSFCGPYKKIKFKYKASWVNSPFYRPQVYFGVQLRTTKLRTGKLITSTKYLRLSRQRKDKLFDVPKAGHNFAIKFFKNRYRKRSIYFDAIMENP